MISQLDFQAIKTDCGRKWEARVNYGKYVIYEFNRTFFVYFYFLNAVKHSWSKRVKVSDDPILDCEKECQKRHEWFVDLVSQNKGE